MSNWRTLPCKPFEGQLSKKGYGRKWDPVAKKKRFAHRITWEAEKGPIPDGLEIDHLCRLRSCQEIAHMELVTHAENVRRGNSPSSVFNREGRCSRGHVIAEIGVYVEPKSGKKKCPACLQLRGTASWKDRRRQR